MSPQCCLVLEGKWDEALARRVLGQELAEDPILLLSSSGSVSAASTARSFLVVRHLPTALVIDSDSSNPDTIEEKRDYYDGALRPYAGPVPYLILVMVPEFEACFFEDPAFLASIGHAPLDPVIRERARFQPKQVLADLLGFGAGKVPATWIAGLPDEAIQILRETTPFKELLAFVHEHAMAAAP